MKLNALRLTRFGCHHEPVSLELQDGLNIVGGENEAGKSTLIRGLQSALFDKYDKKASEILATHNQPSPAVVEVDFDHMGENHHLVKQFRSASSTDKGNAQLSSGGKSFSNKDADEHLAEILGFDHSSSRGLSGSKEQGLFGLLTCSQDNAGVEPDPSDGASQTLQQTLGDQLTSMLGGAHGQKMMERLYEQKGKVLTAKGRPRDEYKNAIDEVDRLKNKKREIEEDLTDLQKRRDNLGKLETDLKKMDRQDEVNDAKKKAKAAANQLAELARKELELKSAKDALKIADLELKDSREEIVRRKERLGKEKNLQNEIKVQGETLDKLQKEREQAQKNVTESTKQLATAEAVLEEKKSLLGQARRYDEYQKMIEPFKELEKALKRARELDIEVQKLKASVAANPITDDKLEQLRNTHGDLKIAGARRKAAATQVHFKTGQEQVMWNGEPLFGEGERLITQKTELSTKAGLVLKVTPGGGNLGEIDLSVTSAKKEFEDLLQQLDCPNLETAVERHAERDQQARDLANKIAQLEILVPNGVVALQHKVETTQSEVADRANAFKDKPKPLPIGNAEKESNDAETTTRKSRTNQEGLQKTFDEKDKELGVARQKLQGHENELENLQDGIRASQKIHSDKILEGEFIAHQAEVTQKKVVYATIEQEIQKLDPESIKNEDKRLSSAFEKARDRYKKLDEQYQQGKNFLLGRGDKEFTKKLAEVERDFLAVQQQHDSLQRRAAALSLACQVLEKHQTRAQDAFQGPVIERFIGYFKRLFPEIEIEINDKLQVVKMRREGNADTFTDLSRGTREQIAVMMRFAFADMLADADQQPIVILDDALISSDSQRRKVMCRLLFEAAERYQVILFTCQMDEYRNCGGHYQAMHELQMTTS